MTISMITFIFFVSFGCLVAAKPQNNFIGKPQWNEQDKAIQKGVLSLGDKILKSLHKENGDREDNILISPINIYSVLNMLYIGSGGKTLEELSMVLGLPSYKDRSQAMAACESLGKMVERLEIKPGDESSTYTEETFANGIFLQNNFRINQEYMRMLEKHSPSAAVRNLDFANNAEEATNEINNWVSERTKGRIPKLYSQALDPSTVAVLTSSLYFSGKWMDPFRETNTKIEKFNTGSHEIDVKMMNNVKRLPYIMNKNLKFEAIRLGFQGHDYEMMIVLPDRSERLETVVQNMKIDDLHALFTDEGLESIDYKIPKTKFSWSKSMNEVLMQQGLQTTFRASELPYLTNSTDMRISQVMHATEIEIDEEGIRASAISGVQMFPVSMPPPPPRNPKPFHVDRPFMMILYHRTTNTVQLTALVHKPTA